MKKDISTISILIESTEELKTFQKGILGVLGKVELDSCDESLKKDLKSVYRLLSLLLINDGSASQSTQAHP